MEGTVMARTLRTYVHVHSDEGSQVYGPGDTVPAAAAKQITNPKAWAEDGETVTPAPAPAPDETPTGDAGTGDAGDAGDAGTGTPNVTDEAPPRNGKGSGADAWRAYAEKLGVATEADWGREDIIAAVDAHLAG